MNNCETKYCRARVKSGTTCSKCKSRKYRLENPVRCSFINLKFNAKRRGKDFTITLDQFREFCIKTNYIAGAGRSSSSYHIDRIDESKGYHIDNIQVLTNSENVRKYLKYSKYRGVPYLYWVETPVKKSESKLFNNLPF